MIRLLPLTVVARQASAVFSFVYAKWAENTLLARAFDAIIIYITAMVSGSDGEPS